jgi:hypothetical protein
LHSYTALIHCTHTLHSLQASTRWRAAIDSASRAHAWCECASMQPLVFCTIQCPFDTTYLSVAGSTLCTCIPTVHMYSCTLYSHCTPTLHSHTALPHFTRTLHSHTALTHCIHTLHSHTALPHFTHTLHSHTAFTHFTHTLHSHTALTYTAPSYTAPSYTAPSHISLPHSVTISLQASGSGPLTHLWVRNGKV